MINNILPEDGRQSPVESEEDSDYKTEEVLAHFAKEKAEQDLFCKNNQGLLAFTHNLFNNLSRFLSSFNLSEDLREFISDPSATSARNDQQDLSALDFVALTKEFKDHFKNILGSKENELNYLIFVYKHTIDMLMDIEYQLSSSEPSFQRQEELLFLIEWLGIVHQEIVSCKKNVDKISDDFLSIFDIYHALKMQECDAMISIYKQLVSKKSDSLMRFCFSNAFKPHVKNYLERETESDASASRLIESIKSFLYVDADDKDLATSPHCFLFYKIYEVLFFVSDFTKKYTPVKMAKVQCDLTEQFLLKLLKESASADENTSAEKNGNFSLVAQCVEKELDSSPDLTAMKKAVFLTSMVKYAVEAPGLVHDRDTKTINLLYQMLQLIDKYYSHIDDTADTTELKKMISAILKSPIIVRLCYLSQGYQQEQLLIWMTAYHTKEYIVKQVELFLDVIKEDSLITPDELFNIKKIVTILFEKIIEAEHANLGQHTDGVIVVEIKKVNFAVKIIGLGTSFMERLGAKHDGLHKFFLGKIAELLPYLSNNLKVYKAKLIKLKVTNWSEEIRRELTLKLLVSVSPWRFQKEDTELLRQIVFMLMQFSDTNIIEFLSFVDQIEESRWLIDNLIDQCPIFKSSLPDPREFNFSKETKAKLFAIYIGQQLEKWHNCCNEIKRVGKKNAKRKEDLAKLLLELHALLKILESAPDRLDYPITYHDYEFLENPVTLVSDLLEKTKSKHKNAEIDQLIDEFQADHEKQLRSNRKHEKQPSAGNSPIVLATEQAVSQPEAKKKKKKKKGKAAVAGKTDDEDLGQEEKKSGGDHQQAVDVIATDSASIEECLEPIGDQPSKLKVLLNLYQNGSRKKRTTELEHAWKDIFPDLALCQDALTKLEVSTWVPNRRNELLEKLFSYYADQPWSIQVSKGLQAILQLFVGTDIAESAKWCFDMKAKYHHQNGKVADLLDKLVTRWLDQIEILTDKSLADIFQHPEMIKHCWGFKEAETISAMVGRSGIFATNPEVYKAFIASIPVVALIQAVWNRTSQRLTTSTEQVSTAYWLKLMLALQQKQTELPTKNIFDVTAAGTLIKLMMKLTSLHSESHDDDAISRDAHALLSSLQKYLVFWLGRATERQITDKWSTQQCVMLVEYLVPSFQRQLEKHEVVGEPLANITWFIRLIAAAKLQDQVLPCSVETSRAITATLLLKYSDRLQDPDIYHLLSKFSFYFTLQDVVLLHEQLAQDCPDCLESSHPVCRWFNQQLARYTYRDLCAYIIENQSLPRSRSEVDIVLQAMPTWLEQEKQRLSHRGLPLQIERGHSVACYLFRSLAENLDDRELVTCLLERLALFYQTFHGAYQFVLPEDNAFDGVITDEFSLLLEIKARYPDLESCSMMIKGCQKYFDSDENFEVLKVWADIPTYEGLNHSNKSELDHSRRLQQIITANWHQLEHPIVATIITRYSDLMPVVSLSQTMLDAWKVKGNQQPLPGLLLEIVCDRITVATESYYARKSHEWDTVNQYHAYLDLWHYMMPYCNNRDWLTDDKITSLWHDNYHQNTDEILCNLIYKQYFFSDPAIENAFLRLMPREIELRYHYLKGYYEGKADHARSNVCFPIIPFIPQPQHASLGNYFGMTSNYLDRPQ